MHSQNTSKVYRKDTVTQNMELEGPEDKCQLQKEPHAKRQVQAAKTSGKDLTSGEGQHIASTQIWYNLSQVYIFHFDVCATNKVFKENWLAVAIYYITG